MERNIENSRKENDTLRNKLIEAEMAVQNLEKYCTNLKIELKTKVADVNTINTKLSRYQEKIRKMEIENTQLKQNYEYARTEWESVNTRYDTAVMKNFSLMKEVKELNEELRNVQKLAEGEEESEEDWGKHLRIVKRGPAEQRQVMCNVFCLFIRTRTLTTPGNVYTLVHKNQDSYHLHWCQIG